MLVLKCFFKKKQTKKCKSEVLLIELLCDLFESEVNDEIYREKTAPPVGDNCMCIILFMKMVG